MSLATTFVRRIPRTLPPMSSAMALRYASSRSSAPKSPASTPAPSKRPESSCKAGTTLSNLNIHKDQSDPIAKEDAEYPDWLWTLLDGGKNLEAGLGKRTTAGEMKDEGFDFKNEQKRLRAVNKASIKATNFLKGT